MKSKKKLGAVAAAMVVASQLGLSSASAEPSPADARRIAIMISEGQTGQLIAFLQANQQAMDGNSALAAALRDFFEQATTLDAAGVVRIELATIQRTYEIASIY